MCLPSLGAILSEMTCQILQATTIHNHPALRCWSPNPPPGQMQTATTAGHGIKLVDDKSIGIQHLNTNPTRSCEDSTKHSEYVKSSLTGYHLYISIPFAPSYLSTIQWLALTPLPVPPGSSVAWDSWRLPHPNLAQVALDAKHPLEKNIFWKDIEKPWNNILWVHIRECWVYYISLFETNLSRMVRRKQIPWHYLDKIIGKHTKRRRYLVFSLRYSCILSFVTFVPSPLAATWDHDFIRIMASMKSCTCRSLVKPRSAGKTSAVSRIFY